MNREDWMRFFLNLRFVSMNLCGIFIFMLFFSIGRESALSSLLAGAVVVILPIVMGTAMFAHGQVQSLAPAPKVEQAEVA